MYTYTKKVHYFLMKAYSQDLRDRVIEIYKRGKINKSQIARLFSVCYGTACEWIKRYETTGNYESKQGVDCGRQPRYDDKQSIRVNTYRLIEMHVHIYRER